MKSKVDTLRTRGWRAREDLIGYLMLLPAFVPYLLFAIIPIGWLVYHSFFRWNGYTDPVFIGVDNFARVLRDDQWWGSVLTTLIYGGGRLLIEIPVGLGLAYIMFRGIRGAHALRTFYFLPHVLAPAIIGIIFSFFLAEVGGPLNQFLMGLGLTDNAINFLGDAQNALRSIIGVGSWANVGIIMLLFFAGLTQIPKEVMESAALEGAGEWKLFRHIVLPMLAPMTRIVILITIIGILRSFDIVKTLTDGGPAGATEVMFTHLYRFFFNPDTIPQIGYAAALGVVASVIIAIVALVHLRLSREGK
ncbi:carbohydrate ABC transporter permease [Ruania zhangjianzhongii]|uniref:carbohydrate ABC transporter permease n=1 Tax=Ruania zhangjianzhongii TaxID=2603206 RepID=UPI0011C8E35E|nr:sugar ABC transporter permease [Ruania zhangjianzhongii]